MPTVFIKYLLGAAVLIWSQIRFLVRESQQREGLLKNLILGRTIIVLVALVRHVVRYLSSSKVTTSK